MKGLFGKVGIVTGGSSGIGQATAMSFAREGAKVVVADVDVECGEYVANEIRRNGGEAIFVKTDVSNEADVQALVRKTVDTFGRLDFAANNAGVVGAMVPLTEIQEKDWNRVLDINLKGVWLCLKYEIQEMLKTGGGAIVNTSSILGQVANPNTAAYTSSKHGVLGLTKVAALEYGPQGIRVSAVCPAYIVTPMLEAAGILPGSESATFAAGLHPVKRLGTPEEVADVITWLCSENATFVTGSSILVDGGYVSQ